MDDSVDVDDWANDGVYSEIGGCDSVKREKERMVMYNGFDVE